MATLVGSAQLFMDQSIVHKRNLADDRVKRLRRGRARTALRPGRAERPVKRSGMGVEGGARGMEQFGDLQVVHVRGG
jgi:hypothetical protein